VSEGGDFSISPDDLVALGRITRTQGHLGAVRMLPFFEPPSEFEKLTTKELFVGCAGTEIPGKYKKVATTAPELKLLHLAGFNYHLHFLILDFEEIPDMSAAEKLRDCIVYVPEQKLWQPQQGEFFAHSVIGFELKDAESGNVAGIVLKVEPGSAHDYLLVSRPGNPARTFLVPIVRLFIERIDFEARMIYVRLPEGLQDL
jgi:16S rRNA processing protein RimM